MATLTCPHCHQSIDLGGQMQTALDKYHQEYELLRRQKDKQLSDLHQQIEELRRRSLVASQEQQGEVFEDNVQDILGKYFSPHDISPVKKGKRGADFLTAVRDGQAHIIGTLIWECKNTKTWSEAWIEKLRQDQIASQANMAILVTRAFPKDSKDLISFREGVWVCDLTAIGPLALALSQSLRQLDEWQKKLPLQNAGLQALREYILSGEFREKVQGLARGLAKLREGIDQERRSMEKFWKAREEQLLLTQNAAVGIFSGLQKMEHLE